MTAIELRQADDELVFESEFTDPEAQREELDWAKLALALFVLLGRPITRSRIEQIRQQGRIPEALIDEISARVVFWVEGTAAPRWRRLWLTAQRRVIGQAAGLGKALVVDDVTIAAFRERWITDRSLLLARGLSAEQVKALRVVLIDYAARGKIPFQTLVKLVREQVGLTGRQAQALVGTREAMRRAGVPAAVIERQVHARAEAMRAFRAETIAITETQSAYQAAYHAAVAYAYESGQLGDALLERVWRTALDERVCPRCFALEGAVVGLYEPFGADQGPVLRPPLHPRCRCGAIIRLASGA